MSQSLVGTFLGQGSLGFNGSFDAGKYIVVLTGTFNTSIVAFNVPVAIVKYNSLSDFDGSYYDIDISDPPSFLGKSSVDLKFVKGSVTLSLTGELVKELPDRQTITGFGKFVRIIPV
jgi:hypothetical protein